MRKVQLNADFWIPATLIGLTLVLLLLINLVRGL
jgi:hypothetical protein